MPNLVYYKDKGGVVSGPLKEEEVTVLYKANFFGPDHVFRIVDANESEDFYGIDALRSLNGDETPFKNVEQNKEVKEENELIRVYKEHTVVLKERNEMQLELNKMKVELEKFNGLKKRIVDEFKTIVFIADSWDPKQTKVVGAKTRALFSDDKSYIYIAPYISDDPLDGSEHVCIFRNSKTTNIEFK